MASKKKHATIIGVPLDYGASKRGASGGPAAIRRANLIEGLEALDLEVTDAGDLPVPKVAASSTGKLKNAAAILKVCAGLEKQTYEAVANASSAMQQKFGVVLIPEAPGHDSASATLICAPPGHDR